MGGYECVNGEQTNKTMICLNQVCGLDHEWVRAAVDIGAALVQAGRLMGRAVAVWQVCF